MRSAVLVTILLCACSSAEDAPSAAARPATITVAGHLQNPNIVEASGLVRSARDPGLLWLVGDGGSGTLLHAVDRTGARRGEVHLREARNIDWEDLAGFEHEGLPYLLIADIGDNHGRRRHLTLYVIEEPTPGGRARRVVEPAWRIDFSYPDGARDAEAVAVDAPAGLVYVLTKRDIPAVLYSVPLRPGGDRPMLAKRLGAIASIPQPSRRDIERAPRYQDWHWQPTAMDFTADGRAAVILTYLAAYLFVRENGEDWLGTFSRRPAAVRLGRYREAEAATFAADGTSLFVTVEKAHAPLLRIELGSIRSP